MALCPRLPGLAGTRKVKPVWILLKQEALSGSGISLVVCKPAPLSRQPRQHPTSQFFYTPDALPATQPTVPQQTYHNHKTNTAGARMHQILEHSNL